MFAAAAFAALAGSAGPSRAAPAIGSISSSVERGSKLVLRVGTSFGVRGTLTVSGTVNGRTVRVRKRARPGSRTLKFTLDPKKARVRRTDGPITFDLLAVAAERGGDSVEIPVVRTIGVPLVLLPGFGNERTPGSMESFATSLDAAANGAWDAGGERPRVIVHEYDSTLPLAETVAGLDAKVKALLRKSPFRKVDVVGYSMGGLVARQWVAGSGRGRVRTLSFLGTPHEGAPVATIALVAAKTGALDALLAAAGSGLDLGALGLDTLLSSGAEGLEVFTPTYDWATLYGFPFQLEAFAGVTSPPLADLNAVGPDPAISSIHAFGYSSVVPEEFGVPIGTVDVVEVSSLLAPGGGFDFSDPEALLSLASGDGDGVVPAHSAWMDSVTAWSGAPNFTKHDAGSGTHLTYTADPRVLAALADILTK